MSKRKQKKQSIVHVTTKHTGKMKGINSLSTSCLTCGRCAKYSKVKGSVCKHCFARTTQERYKALALHLANNSVTLSDHIFTSEEIASISVTGEVFRFESFGDLQSVIQAINYINIARANRKTMFALWTKNPDILAAAVKAGYKVPKNMCIGLSSLFTDLPYNKKVLIIGSSIFMQTSYLLFILLITHLNTTLKSIVAQIIATAAVAAIDGTNTQCMLTKC